MQENNCKQDFFQLNFVYLSKRGKNNATREVTTTQQGRQQQCYKGGNNNTTKEISTTLQGMQQHHYVEAIRWQQQRHKEGNNNDTKEASTTPQRMQQNHNKTGKIM